MSDVSGDTSEAGLLSKVLLPFCVVSGPLHVLSSAQQPDVLNITFQGLNLSFISKDEVNSTSKAWVQKLAQCTSTVFYWSKQPVCPDAKGRMWIPSLDGRSVKEFATIWTLRQHCNTILQLKKLQHTAVNTLFNIIQIRK